MLLPLCVQAHEGGGPACLHSPGSFQGLLTSSNGKSSPVTKLFVRIQQYLSFCFYFSMIIIRRRSRINVYCQSQKMEDHTQLNVQLDGDFANVRRVAGAQNLTKTTSFDGQSLTVERVH
jgi:hypothetical protein